MGVKREVWGPDARRFVKDAEKMLEKGREEVENSRPM